MKFAFRLAGNLFQGLGRLLSELSNSQTTMALMRWMRWKMPVQLNVAMMKMVSKRGRTFCRATNAV